ncbi:TPA: transglycosylase SLT domain-containing protein [Klebsiella pneumoniae]
MNAYSLSRLFIAWLTCLATLLFAPLLPAVEAEKAPPAAAEDNTLSIHIDDMLRPWRGDLPGMIDRRTIRVLTTYSKTFFFIDKGTQRGATHDIFIALENDLNKQERRKFLAMVDVFRKYGDRYDVDWLLMAAQGYQESRLNQSVRSHVGAIGVMQVMPSTGKELKVGDIKQLDPNIHAGVKYMRWMMDRYYADEPMTRLDKALFTFASYNAGPARIARLRTMTKQRGFDPNVWFGNVENMAAEKIGAETVTYVSNIYKYYIAYRLIVDDMARKQKATAVPRQEPVAQPAKPQPSVATAATAQVPVI